MLFHILVDMILLVKHRSRLEVSLFKIYIISLFLWRCWSLQLHILAFIWKHVLLNWLISYVYWAFILFFWCCLSIYELLANMWSIYSWRLFVVHVGVIGVWCHNILFKILLQFLFVYIWWLRLHSFKSCIIILW